MQRIKKAWPALLAAAALAVALPACGDDETERNVNDAVEDVQREGREAGESVGDKARDVGRDAKREGEQAVD